MLSIYRAYLTAQLNSGVLHVGCPFQHECDTCISQDEMSLILPQAAEVGAQQQAPILQGRDREPDRSVLDNLRGDYFIMSTNAESDRDLDDGRNRGQSQSDNAVELQVHEAVLLDSQPCPQCRVVTYRLNSCNQIRCRACATVSASAVHLIHSCTPGWLYLAVIYTI